MFGIIKRSIKYLYIILIAFLSVIIFLINTRMYYPVKQSFVENSRSGNDIIFQLNFLKNKIVSGTAKEMQGVFPEGYFFTYLLYGLTWAELCTQVPVESEIWQRGQKKAYWALGILDSDYPKDFFYKNLDPPYGAFYISWRTWFRGTLLKSQPTEKRDSIQSKIFLNDCIALKDAFEKKGIPFIESYPDAVWPADFIIGIAALRLHDNIFEPKFSDIIATWLKECKKRLDPETGLIPHSVNPVTCYTAEGARGSSQSLILRFLYVIDENFAREQYLIFKKLFVRRLFGLPCVREYPINTSGTGDIDSGPVILGIGASATIVSLGTARTFNDFNLSKSLEQTFETFGLPLRYNSQKKYLFGNLPIGDAFLVWSKIPTPISEVSNKESYKNTVSWWWRLPFHILSTIILTLLLLPIYFTKKNKSK
jgi:hypothetical protein